MKISDHIYPTIGDNSDGCGVLIGNLFITAAHVVEDNPFYLRIGEQLLILKKEEALIYEYNPCENGGDIAIFKIDNYCSPIRLDNMYPQKGMTLNCVWTEHIVETDSNDIFSIKESYAIKKCDAVINEVEGNFFQCKTTDLLKPGSSGSPVVRGDRVVGFLHGGHPGQPICVFQSSISIIDKLVSAGINYAI